MPRATSKTKTNGKVDRLNAAARRATAAAREPLWSGPNAPGPNGGITQGLLGRWFADRERCRLQAIDGWRPADRFEPKIEYGNMWHVCEEVHAAGRDPLKENDLFDCAGELDRRYQRQRDEIAHWTGMCAALFPEYVRHWAVHPDQQKRTPLLQEQIFDVSCELPSGRNVRLRGKWDSVDLVDGRVWIQENKTKSGIDSVKIMRQCRNDLQSLFYLVALTESNESWQRLREDNPGKGRKPFQIAGIRYNCVRRPAHKTVESAMKTFGVDSRNGRIGDWFARFSVDVSADDLARFRRFCLNPALENLVDDWEWWDWCFRHGPSHDPFDWQARSREFPSHRARHFLLPYGVYSPVLEGGFSDMDALIETGSTAGLVRATVMYPELQQEM